MSPRTVVMLTACGVSASLLAVGCGLLSRASYAESTCSDCKRPALLTGDPIRVDITFPEGKEETQPPAPTLFCSGVECDSGDADLSRSEGGFLSGAHGTTSLSVIPTTTGTLTLHATLKDLGTSRSWSYGPFTVQKPDRIGVRCQIPGSPPRACENIGAGDPVRLEIGLYVRETRVVSPSVKVLIDGKPVAAPWSCVVSASSADGAGPVVACVAASLPSGSHELVASRAELRNDIQLVVR